MFLAPTVSGDSVVGRSQADPFLADFAVAGASVPCREYQTANGTRFSTYQWWLTGFLAGATRARTELKLSTNAMSVADALGWIDRYCVQRPNAPLSEAAAALLSGVTAETPQQ